MKKHIILVLAVLAVIIAVFFILKNADWQSKKGGNGHQNLKADEISIIDDWLTAGLKKAGLENCAIWKTSEGYIQSTKERATVYILYDTKRYGEDSIYNDFYMAIQTKEKIILKDLKTDDYCGSYRLDLYVCDVTGDGLDEIAIQSTVGMTGGAGQYLSRIFKLYDSEVREIFYSSPIKNFDTGFSSTFEDNYRLLILNSYTKYENVIDFSTEKKYQDLYFDADGNVIKNDVVSCDSFFEFVPQDTDNDNVFEIICKQYASICGHSDYVGEAQSILKYNRKTKTFEIINAKFDNGQSEDGFGQS